MGPLDEVRTVMTAFDETLFRVVPALYRSLDHVLTGEDCGRVPAAAPASCGTAAGWAATGTATRS